MTSRPHGLSAPRLPAAAAAVLAALGLLVTPAPAAPSGAHGVAFLLRVEGVQETTWSYDHTQTATCTTRYMGRGHELWSYRSRAIRILVRLSHGRAVLSQGAPRLSVAHDIEGRASQVTSGPPPCAAGTQTVDSSGCGRDRPPAGFRLTVAGRRAVGLELRGGQPFYSCPSAASGRAGSRGSHPLERVTAPLRWSDLMTASVKLVQAQQTVERAIGGAGRASIGRERTLTRWLVRLDRVR